MTSNGNWNNVIQYADNDRILLFLPIFSYVRINIDIYFGSYNFFPWREARIEIDVINYKEKEWYKNGKKRFIGKKRTYKFFPNLDLKAERFLDDLEYQAYRYGILDNCTCDYIMDNNNKYIKSITKYDKQCYAHGDS